MPPLFCDWAGFFAENENLILTDQLPQGELAILAANDMFHNQLNAIQWCCKCAMPC